MFFIIIYSQNRIKMTITKIETQQNKTKNNNVTYIVVYLFKSSSVPDQLCTHKTHKFVSKICEDNEQGWLKNLETTVLELGKHLSGPD